MPAEPCDDLVKRLRTTTEQMACSCSVPMNLWQDHSSAVLTAATRIASDANRIAELEAERDQWDRRVAYDELKTREYENRATQQRQIDAMAIRAETAERELDTANANHRDMAARLKDMGTKLEAAERALAEERERCAALDASLTPSADTKSAYIGEFSFFIDTLREDDDGEEVFIAERVLVPWDTVKEIMKVIRDYATAIRSGKP